MWDAAHLERQLSRHPEVVLRLFAEALSMQGRFQAMESRFWNKLEFITHKTLTDLWVAREEIDVSAMGVFAAIANEFAHGDISKRSWGAILDENSLLEVLHLGLVNVGYLLMRIAKSGANEKPIVRSLTYLVLCALGKFKPDTVAELIEEAVTRGDPKGMPDEVCNYLLMPILDQLMSEMQDVCSANCPRMMMLDRNTLTEEKDEPCLVGFAVDADNGCPLFELEANRTNIEEILEHIKRIAEFRKSQSSE